MVRHTNNLTYFFRILIKTINVREKSPKSGGGIPPPSKIFITRQPKVIESRNRYQIIAMVLLYNHRIRFMKNKAFLVLNIDENLKY